MRWKKDCGSIDVLLAVIGSILQRRLLLVAALWVGSVECWDNPMHPSLACRSSGGAARRRAAAAQHKTLRPNILVPAAPAVFRIPESHWRAAAESHQTAVYELLQPGLLDPKQGRNSGIQRQRVATTNGDPDNSSSSSTSPRPVWTALDPKHPVFNFLIEYYGQKGVKSVRRLAQWTPALHPHGVLLEGATDGDLFHDLLFLRGAMLRSDGIEYNPRSFFAAKQHEDHTDDNDNKEVSTHTRNTLLERAAAPFLWNRSVLERTLQAEPVWHCYGLHEWAMQYQPVDGAPPPPAAQYQAHLPLRVSQSVLNETVERKGVHCTHVDAWRYFSPASLPLHHYHTATTATTTTSKDDITTPPTTLSFSRSQQLQLEQPACVHANMDLLKYALRLRPFVDADLVRRALAVALHARTLDVAASPYNAWEAYGIPPVPVETAAGRAEYRQRQVALYRDHANPVRRDLLTAYTKLLDGAFPGILQRASTSRSVIPSSSDQQATVRHDPAPDVEKEQVQ